MASPGNLLHGKLVGISFGAARSPIRPIWEIQSNPKIPSNRGSACLAGLGLLGFHRLVPASLALPAPRNNDTGHLRRPARRFAPQSLLLVQARRARPVRGEDSQASQGQASKPSQRWMVYKPWVPSQGGLQRKISPENSNPQILDMPAWQNLVKSWSDLNQQLAKKHPGPRCLWSFRPGIKKLCLVST